MPSLFLLSNIYSRELRWQSGLQRSASVPSLYAGQGTLLERSRCVFFFVVGPSEVCDPCKS
jgi:hypothetical protein